MTETFRENRKIEPSRGAMTATIPPMIWIASKLARQNWRLTNGRPPGLSCLILQQMSRFRHNRLVRGVTARDYGALVVFDPLNIRYASDSANMQLWNSHNPFRALIVCADG